MFKTEMHLHTKESSACSWMYAEEMVKAYYDAGYSTLVITDHFLKGDISWEEKVEKSLLGYYKAKEAAKKYNINILMSTEMAFEKTRPNHYLLLGITEEFLLSNPDISDMSVEEFYPIAKENGILVVQAHPFRDENCYPTADFVDAIEVYNACPRKSDYSHKSLKVAEENNLYKTAGSDTHRLEDVGRGGIMTNTEIKTMDDLIKAIKSQSLEIIYAE